MDAETDDTVAVVDEYPDCDIHMRMFDTRVPAGYDAALRDSGMWAYMCANCFPKWGTGQLGLGIGQRLVLAADSGREA